MSPVQDKIIARLAAGETITSAAAQLKIHRTTIHHWKRTDPDFTDAVRDAQADAAAQTRALYQAHAATALAVLLELMNNPSTAPSVRLKAALYVLTQSAVPAPQPATKEERRTARLLRVGLDPQTEADTYADYAAQQDAEYAAGLAALQPPSSLFITSTASASSVLPDPSTPITTFVRTGPKIGRNEPCPCGSGQKFKRCCRDKQLSPRQAA